VGSSLPDWSNFFVAQVSAASALAGLLFVAISINLATILKYRHLPGRAAETLVAVVGVLIQGSFGLIPLLPLRTHGLLALGIGTIMGLFSVAMHIRSGSLVAGQSDERNRPLRIALSTLPSIAIVIGALLLMQLDANGLYWIAFGMIAALLAAMINAWVLLVEIVR
jgi:modulator of FtsH protease